MSKTRHSEARWWLMRPVKTTYISRLFEVISSTPFYPKNKLARYLQTATDNFKISNAPLTLNPWDLRFSLRAPVLLKGLQRFRELPSQVSRSRWSIGVLSIGHLCVGTSAHFIKRSNELIRTPPLAHHVQNRSTVPLKISHHHIMPQAFAHILVLQPIQHRISDFPRLDEGFVRR